ncbi:DUF5694 domain-containing protein [Zunongwangia sp. HRR-M8]|uniref:DUF5694 domain-containing protein n=1 Tax=Zunongwangia sp. HRR-M8 TaxID=3015170 RepID=UPI0022DE2E0A|nr:DUF5694 domain-containing protein [Zunongwangia sp. HRR-M8]WBL22203.1 DUF5694 domain-containing protein [Zunongwangia sp. HRR-M8]
MKTILISLLLSVSFSSIFSQSRLKDPDEFLRKGEKIPKVLLVGSFHFNYPGLDAHQISEEKKINHNLNDRILVIFGAGHVSILKWLFECTPEFELVKFNEL